MNTERSLSMMKTGRLLAVVSCAACASLWATQTSVTVRVKSRDAKFVGSSMGGVQILIRNVDTGELLAKGVTAGGTGNTDRIMKTPKERHESYADESAAKFVAVVDIDAPTLVEIEAYGPLAQRQSAARASVTQWLLPGKHIMQGDAVMLELPGFVVDVLDPPAHIKLNGVPQTVEIHANVTMMCGCPVEPDGIWDAKRYEIAATIVRNGEAVADMPLRYAGEKSQFAGRFDASVPGVYTITVYAFDPATGNAGVDTSTVIVQRE
jgi:hypothetical protein